MKPVKCQVRACGSKVLMVEIEGRPVAVNPRRVKLVAVEPDGDCRWVAGYMPHAYTCADISDRPKHGRQQSG